MRDREGWKRETEKGGRERDRDRRGESIVTHLCFPFSCVGKIFQQNSMNDAVLTNISI